MRVLHLVTSVGQTAGGLGPAVLGLAGVQSAFGCHPVIWSLDTPAEVSTLGRADGCRIVPLPIVGPRGLGYSAVAEHEAAGMASREYDICHQHSLWMANSRVTQRWRSTSRRPTVISPHGTLKLFALKRSGWKKRIAALWYEKANLCQASCLHATSDLEASSFRGYGLRNPIAVIPLGIPDDLLQGVGDGTRFRYRHAIPDDTRIMLFLSRIHPIKGLPILFEALVRIRERLTGWRLAIIGPDEADHGQQLQLLARKLGIADFVIFGHPVYGQDKLDAFAAADLCILPSYTENFGIAVAEALGAGVPVITTRGAPWEDLWTYRCGWWVDLSITTIQETLLDAIQRSTAELEEMGRRGRNLIARKYTWRRIGEQSLMLYEWLLGHAECPDFLIVD